MTMMSEVVGICAGDGARLNDVGDVVVKWFGAGVVDADADAGAGAGVFDGSGAALCHDDDGGEVVRGEGDDASDGVVARRLVITATVGSEDRKGDLVDSNGWELDGYRRNPVFLWAHDRGLPPIGKAVRVWVEGSALKALVEFAPGAFAEQVAELYAKGFMRGVSVGFIPLETEMRKASSGRRGYWYKRQELLEISAVPVPMHAGALAGGSTSESRQSVSEFLQMRQEMRNLWRAVAGMEEM